MKNKEIQGVDKLVTGVCSVLKKIRKLELPFNFIMGALVSMTGCTPKEAEKKIGESLNRIVDNEKRHVK